MTRRRWIASEFDRETATLTGAQADHLARVLRATAGMQAEIVAGDRLFRAVVAEVAPAAVRFRLEEELPAASPSAPPVTLLVAVFKFDRLEWAIEKATELGVAAIHPALARRTEKHLAQAAAARVQRWRRIAIEATQQSRGSFVPAIHDPQPLATLLAAPLETPAADTRILLSEHEAVNPSALTLADRIQSLAASSEAAVTLAIGPEGGWTSEETARFAETGWLAASLGPRILRAETAIIASLAITASLLATDGPHPPSTAQQSFHPRST